METKKTWQKKRPATEYEKEVGRRIRECRERLGLSAETLAEVLGVSPASILQYELGIRSPSLERLAALTRELGVSADFLLSGMVEGKAELTPELGQLIKVYERLSPRDKGLILEIVVAFLKSPSV